MLAWAIVIAVSAVQPSADLHSSKALVLRRDVTVAGRELRLSDLADLSVLPPTMRAHARMLTLVRFSGSSSRIMISDREIVSRARARMPALAGWLPMDAGKSVEVRFSGGVRVAPAGSAGCVRAIRRTAAGTAPSAQDFEAAACPQDRKRAFRYDRVSGSTKAVRAIEAGEVVTAWAGFGGDRVEPGQRLMLTSYAGPARVERPVEATQSARPGQRLFVRSSDGVYHSVRYEAAP